jgi:hypothetical protein
MGFVMNGRLETPDYQPTPDDLFEASIALFTASAELLEKELSFRLTADHVADLKTARDALTRIIERLTQ